MHGYYRNRVVFNQDLDLQRHNGNINYSNNRFGVISYNQMRLRLEPTYKINDWISLHGQFDVLDNVLFGSSDVKQLRIIAPVVGEQTLPEGGGTIYLSGPSTIGENGAINIRRVWTELFTPIGKFRIGRQPSHWGLGIFQHDGNDKQSDFGDTADRILYVGQFEKEGIGTFTGGIFWDMAYEAQFDPRINGLGTNPAANNRDLQQYGAMFMFEKPELTLGLIGGLRRRNGPDGATTMTVQDALGNSTAAGIDGDTLVHFFDIYAKYVLDELEFAFEGVYMGGKISTGLALDAVPFAGLGAGEGIIQLAPKQNLRVLMGVLEAKANYQTGDEWHLKVGYAQGDGSPLSNRITMYGFRPDYQIALMMFNMPLGSTASLWGSKANGTGASEYLAGGKSLTGNFINNALFVSSKYSHQFDFPNQDYIEWLKVGGTISTAWAPKKNTSLNLDSLISQAGDWPSLTETSTSMWKRWYGVECDIRAEAKLFNHMIAVLEGGYLFPGSAYDINMSLIDTGSIVEPVPRDNANSAWMFRLSTIVEF